MAKKSVKDWIKLQNKRVKAVESIKPVFLAASSSHAIMVPRIFEQGKKATGQKIGNYTNEQYREKRQKRGRQTSRVDLKFNGLLQLDFANSLTIDGKKVVAGLKNAKENQGKFEGSIDRYGKEVWQLSVKEKKIYELVLADEAGKLYINA